MSRVSLVLLSAAILLVSVSHGLAAPLIEVEERNFDFGHIFQGEKVHHTYTFRNSGDQPLLIDKVRTSCGCTAALLSAKTLAPGENGEISVTFDSARFRGPIKKTIYLHANDPQRGVTQFTLTGTVEQEIVLTPQRLKLGPVAAEETTSAEITLANRGTGTLSLKINRVSLAGVKAQLDKTTLAPGESSRLQVEATAAKGQPRQLNGWILVDTDSPATPQLRIPVFLSVN